MMIEPPGDFGRRGVFEVDNCVLVAGELRLVKESACAMDKAVILIAGAVVDALAVEAREERG
jgi:hypothetical protein